MEYLRGTSKEALTVAEYDESNQNNNSTNAEADIYDEVSDEQKNWQRQLNRARDQNKELLKGYLELGETKAALSRVLACAHTSTSAGRAPQVYGGAPLAPDYGRYRKGGSPKRRFVRKGYMTNNGGLVHFSPTKNNIGRLTTG